MSDGANPGLAPTRVRLKRGAVGSIIAQFKSIVTKRILTKDELFGPVWQRNYYEHVIRNDAALNNIRSYLQMNPSKWIEDDEYQS